MYRRKGGWAGISVLSFIKYGYVVSQGYNMYCASLDSPWLILNIDMINNQIAWGM